MTARSKESKLVSQKISLNEIKANIQKCGDGFAVRIPTQGDYDTMMQYYQISGKEFKEGSKIPTDHPYPEYLGPKNNLCVYAGESPLLGSDIQFEGKDSLEKKNWTIYTVKELFDSAGLSLESQEEMNRWFDLIKPNRASKMLKTVKISDNYKVNIPHYIHFSRK